MVYVLTKREITDTDDKQGKHGDKNPRSLRFFGRVWTGSRKQPQRRWP